jgi:hypothetical protein
METTQTTVKMVFDRWNAMMEKCDAIFDALSDEAMQKEIAPGKNRAIYLLGHLIAVHDNMLPLLDLGDKKYPELYEPFITSPDKSVSGIPSAQELRACWKEQKLFLEEEFQKLQPEAWFERHTSVSAEEFAKEPHRNKLNIIITRTSHLGYHVGQLALI